MKKRRLWLVALCVPVLRVLGACSDDAASTPTNDGGSSSGGNTGPDASADSPSDAPPDVSLFNQLCTGTSAKGSVGGIPASQGQPALPIDITWTSGGLLPAVCPAKAVVTSSSPFATWTLDVGMTEGYLKASAASFKTTLTPFMSPLIFSPAAPGILLQIVKTIPAYDPAKAHVLVSLGTANTPCTKAGSTVTAPGHSEAVIKYIDSDGNDLGAGQTTMNTDGLAVITNLDPTIGGGKLDPGIVAAGGTCNITYTWSTKTVPLLVDTVSILNAEAKP